MTRIHYEYDYDNGNHKNKKMIDRFKNWKTTLTGIVIALLTGLQWEHGTELAELLTQAIAFIALLLAKD